MAEFLVEVYVSRTNRQALRDGAERARGAAEALSREGTAVTYLSAIFVPDDETCFFFFEAGSADVVREAAHRAALAFEHVGEVVSDLDPNTGRDSDGSPNEPRPIRRCAGTTTREEHLQ